MLFSVEIFLLVVHVYDITHIAESTKNPPKNPDKQDGFLFFVD